MKESLNVTRRSRWVVAAVLLLMSVASHATAPAGRYSINAAAGIVKDNVTGLTWQRCAGGLSGADCASGTAGTYTQSDAYYYCKALVLGGYPSDTWQLPTIRALQTIVDPRVYNPAVDGTAFPGTSSTYFWTDTWAVQFGDGSTQWMGTGNTYQVRCVHY